MFLNTRRSLNVNNKNSVKSCFILCQNLWFLKLYILGSAYESAIEEVLWKYLTLRQEYDTEPDWITRPFLTTNVSILGLLEI